MGYLGFLPAWDVKTEGWKWAAASEEMNVSRASRRNRGRRILFFISVCLLAGLSFYETKVLLCSSKLVRDRSSSVGFEILSRTAMPKRPFYVFPVWERGGKRRFFSPTKKAFSPCLRKPWMKPQSIPGRLTAYTRFSSRSPFPLLKS